MVSHSLSMQSEIPEDNALSLASRLPLSPSDSGEGDKEEASRESTRGVLQMGVVPNCRPSVRDSPSTVGVPGSVAGASQSAQECLSDCLVGSDAKRGQHDVQEMVSRPGSPPWRPSSPGGRAASSRARRAGVSRNRMGPSGSRSGGVQRADCVETSLGKSHGFRNTKHSDENQITSQPRGSRLDADDLKARLSVLFVEFAAQKSFAGLPLLNCPNFLELLKQISCECPEVRMMKTARQVSVYNEVLELQRDLCFQVGLERSEASRGLTLEYFHVALQKTMPKGWHTSLAASAFEDYAVARSESLVT